MLSKSKSYSISFTILAVALVAFYASGASGPLIRGLADGIVAAVGGEQSAGMSRMLADVFGVLGGFPDYWIFALLLVLAGVACACGASPACVMSAASVAAMVVLTLNQTPLVRYLTLAALLFSIGMYGMVVSRNAIRVLMSIELMLNAVNVNLVAFARYVDPEAIRGQIFAIFILTVAAAEAAVGLAIVLAIYRSRSTVDMEKFNLLKW